MLKKTYCILFGVLIFLTGERLLAQDADGSSAYASEFGVYAGSFLPDQIPGITEILPMAGMRYSWLRDNKKSYFELGVFGGNDSGMSLYGVEASVRGEITLRDLTAVFTFGPDYITYLPLGAEKFQSGFGAHFSTGLMTRMGGNAWFRVDMKFNFNPGTALHVGFGLVFRQRDSGN